MSELKTGQAVSQSLFSLSQRREKFKRYFFSFPKIIKKARLCGKIMRSLEKAWAVMKTANVLMQLLLRAFTIWKKSTVVRASKILAGRWNHVLWVCKRCWFLTDGSIFLNFALTSSEQRQDGTPAASALYKWLWCRCGKPVIQGADWSWRLVVSLRKALVQLISNNYSILYLWPLA